MPNTELQIIKGETLKNASTKHNGARRWALVILGLMLLCILRNILVYIQKNYQLTSPLIPRDTVDLIRRPFLYCALGLAAIFAVNLILMYRARYRWAIVLGAVALLAQSVYQAAAQYGLLN
jgi:cell division protein FtsW (lipid II flippase)